MKQVKKVVCFGELLWDMLPSGKKPGGAPMNVAYHLRQLGISSELISRVGGDTAGEELRSFLTTIKLPTEYLQTDSVYTTSKVLVHVGKDHEVSYDILAPVAWDFISCEDHLLTLVKEADVFVFGSLAARMAISRNTLLRLLDEAKYAIFDVNLRAPHYQREVIEMLIQKADVIKVNLQELFELAAWLGMYQNNEESAVARLQDTYQLKEIIVTKGAQGASYYTLDSSCNYAAKPVVVTDTVGSGDSFLAAFVSQRLKNESIDAAMKFAISLSAYVTTQEGACPDYSIQDLEAFM